MVNLQHQVKNMDIGKFNDINQRLSLNVIAGTTTMEQQAEEWQRAHDELKEDFDRQEKLMKSYHEMLDKSVLKRQFGNHNGVNWTTPDDGSIKLHMNNLQLVSVGDIIRHDGKIKYVLNCQYDETTQDSIINYALVSNLQKMVIIGNEQKPDQLRSYVGATMTLRAKMGKDCRHLSFGDEIICRDPKNPQAKVKKIVLWKVRGMSDIIEVINMKTWRIDLLTMNECGEHWYVGGPIKKTGSELAQVRPDWRFRLAPGTSILCNNDVGTIVKYTKTNVEIEYE